MFFMTFVTELYWLKSLENLYTFYFTVLLKIEFVQDIFLQSLMFNNQELILTYNYFLVLG